MQQELLSEQDAGFTWLDLYAPDEDELLSTGLIYELPLKPMHDCLEQDQLPKYEEHGFTHYFLVRRFFENAKEDSAEFEDITRRVAVLFHENVLITIHRISEHYMLGIRDLLVAEHAKTRRHFAGARGFESGGAALAFRQQDHEASPHHIQVLVIAQLLRDVLYSYESAVDSFDLAFEKFEDLVFHGGADKLVLEGTYLQKRRMSAFRRMLRLNLDVIRKLEVDLESESRVLEYLFADGERFLALVDGAIDNIHTLLNLHMSSQSNHTNETVRVLTIFSAFFMPLTFIAGVYGMNFKYMFGLEHELGFPVLLLVMILVSWIIYVWFKRKRWIG